MTIRQLNQFYEELKNEGIIFSFSGPISQVIVESIGITLRKKMQMEATGLSTIQRVFSVFVEQMQNILNYSAEVTPSFTAVDEDLRSGVLILGHEDDSFYVCCGNYIERAAAEKLAGDLAALRPLSRDELKKLYKKQRKSDPPEGSAGAGLGLIEMARRSSRPIDFDIKPINGGYCFFSIKAVI